MRRPTSNYRNAAGHWSPTALKVGKTYERLTKRLLKEHAKELHPDDIQTIAWESVHLPVLFARLDLTFKTLDIKPRRKRSRS